MSLRDSLKPDVPPLGKKIERPAPPPPPRQVKPGILEHDGKLHTNLPLPPLHIPVPLVIEDPGLDWPFPIADEV